MSILLYRCRCLSFFLSSLSLYLVRPCVFPDAIIYGTSTRNVQFFSIKTREGGGGRTGQIKNWMTSIVFSHVGDLGNVYSDERGMISTKIVDHLVSLVGEYSVLGRSFVVSWSNLLTQLYGTSCMVRIFSRLFLVSIPWTRVKELASDRWLLWLLWKRWVTSPPSLVSRNSLERV